jgi:uncharacterized repeat protein (TIGR03803 family)
MEEMTIMSTKEGVIDVRRMVTLAPARWPRRFRMLWLILAATAIASPAQTFTTLNSFDGTNGASPESELIQATDGNLYGTTPDGGANGDGTVYRMTLSGALTPLYSFCSLAACADGQNPEAALVQANDGNFYGTTYAGGTYGYRTVFKLTPSRLRKNAVLLGYRACSPCFLKWE